MVILNNFNTLNSSTFKTKIITVTSQLNSTEDELNDCFHNSHKLELDQNKNVRQWSEQRKELNEKIEAARDQIGLAPSCTYEIRHLSHS